VTVWLGKILSRFLGSKEFQPFGNIRGFSKRVLPRQKWLKLLKIDIGGVMIVLKSKSILINKAQKKILDFLKNLNCSNV